jgi:teichoic acid transport system ATP-binding protein
LLSASERAVERAGPALDPVIAVENLSVTYRATYEKKPTLKQTLVRLGRRERTVRRVEALRGVSFGIAQGAVLGIVGVNGAGKSTLMRAIAGILPPSEGRIVVDGRVSTLLALGVGFNSELSGRENVILGGLAAGLRRDELAAKYDAIAAFAELGDFMDLPMRTYSSGMYGRLAFSVAVNMNPDILLIDEALSVGDARFKRKSFEKIRELCSQARTIVIVSHALKTLGELCTEALWLNEGRVELHADPGTVISAYRSFLDIGETDDMAEEDL